MIRYSQKTNIGLSIPLAVLAFIIFFTLDSNAGITARQAHKVTITAQNIPLKNVFNTINKQTGLTIRNNPEETKLDERKRVTVNFVQTDINAVMTFLLSEKKDLGFLVENKSISIYKIIPSAEKKIKRENQHSSASRYPFVGKITDILGNPIPGATIKIKKTNRGTISDDNGSFELSNMSNGDVIIITALGFESSEITVYSESISVVLKPYINNLDEKVVIAYGLTTKRFNTGNIGGIKAKDMETQPINNPILGLQGRVAGVYIEQSSGLPGTSVTINVQGKNSIRNGSDPFYVIDGVPYISQLLQPYSKDITSGNTPISGNPLNFINPADIESIEVLKDADATSIYGSRAANGAVLITTKRGKVGPMTVNFNLQNGWGKVGHKLDVLNTKQYLEMRREALKNDGMLTPSVSDYDLNGMWDTTQNKDWQKEIISGSALYRDIQLGVSGGTENIQYLISGGYHKETAVFPGNFSDTKGSLHFNIRSASKNQKLRVQLSGVYIRDNNQLPQMDPTASAVQLAPVAPNPLNADGTLNWQPTATGATTFFANPLIYTKQLSEIKTASLASQAMVSYDILQGLTLRSSFGYNSLRTNELKLNPTSTARPEILLYARPQTTFANSIMDSWVIEPQLELTKNIHKGKLNVLLGSTIQNNKNNRETILGSGFLNDLLMKDISSATNLLVWQSLDQTYKYNAIYSRINYNLLDKYILNLTARRDGSSRFGSRNQFHNFGSVGAAWIFTQTNLIQKIAPFLSFGKLRGSYGITGNDQIPDYQYLDLYQSIPADAPYQQVLGLRPVQLYNPDLQWESTKKLQVGIEIGMLKDKIMLIANYNRNRSSNQLISAPLPSTTGFNILEQNIAAVVQNIGWEFTVSTANARTRSFSWNSSFNLTIPKNKLVSFIDIPDPYYIVGKSITTTRISQLSGVNPSTGLFQFSDAKGNLTDNPTEFPAYSTNDPYFYGGLQNNITYKGFALDFLFQFVKRAGPELSYGYGFGPGMFNRGLSNQPITILNRWQKEGDEAFQQKYSTTNGLNQLTVQNSDAAYEDSYYIRLKNVSLSWQIPDNWRNRMHIQNLKLYALAQNVFTITDYFGLDPESRGIGLPPLRVITLGIQASF